MGMMNAVYNINGMYMNSGIRSKENKQKDTQNDELEIHIA